MKVIGITGGLGSGKTTVSSHIREAGYTVMDADQIARNVAAEQTVLDEIRKEFGEAVMTADGTLDRKAMAEIVFNEPEKKKTLEAIITRRVIEQVEQQIDDFRAGRTTVKGDTLFLDAPTLFETGTDRLVDEVWVVTCNEQKRIERAISRDEAKRADIEARMRQQMSEELEKERADRIITNDSTLEDLINQVDELLSIVTQNE